jgi:hypothetical protein
MMLACIEETLAYVSDVDLETSSVGIGGHAIFTEGNLPPLAQAAGPQATTSAGPVPREKLVTQPTPRLLGENRLIAITRQAGDSTYSHTVTHAGRAGVRRTGHRRASRCGTVRSGTWH